MKRSNELEIFGYVDLCDPPPGSWKAEVFEIVGEAEITDARLEASLVAEFKFAVSRMREVQAKVLSDQTKAIRKG